MDGIVARLVCSCTRKPAETNSDDNRDSQFAPQTTTQLARKVQESVTLGATAAQ